MQKLNIPCINTSAFAKLCNTNKRTLIHYDEIGFQIVYISDNGMLYFRPNGGIDKLNIPASEVEILTANGRVPGVIGKKPIHLLSPAEREKALDLSAMWIDIGAENREEAEKIVSIGDPVALKSKTVVVE